MPSKTVNNRMKTALTRIVLIACVAIVTSLLIVWWLYAVTH